MKTAVPEFQECEKKQLSILAKSLKNKYYINFFAVIFQGFCLLFRDTSLKEHTWMAAYAYFNGEVLQGSTFFLGKEY